jgi:hypothetical protein
MKQRHALSSLTILGVLSLYGADARSQTLTWTDLDCARSDILLAQYSKCQMQTSITGNEGRGQFQSQSATYRSANEFVFVYLQKPTSSFYNASIKVSAEIRETYLSKPSAEAGQKGTNFSTTNRVTGGYVKTFLLPPDWKCFSFSKDAPYRGDGFAYWLVGYACGKSSSWQTESSMVAFLQKLGVK